LGTLNPIIIFKMEVLFKVNNKNHKKKQILSVDKTDNISKEIWHRRLGHFYQDNSNKYLEMPNIKKSIMYRLQNLKN